MNPSEYYAQQSPITDPGKHTHLFDELPRDIAGLCRVVQGLIIHYMDGEKLFDYVIPKERLPEVDTCYVEKMLARILELDHRPLTEARPPERRLVGCCRDFATLFCSMARHHGIPTRNRAGFGAYFRADFNVDHEIVEYWDVQENLWRLVDPELSDIHIKAYDVSFDPCDVPREQFIIAGLAWQMCRAGKADPDKFGLDPETEVKGWWFIRDRLIHDLLALNKIEVLLWHSWGLMEYEATLNDQDLALLDRIALLTQEGNEAFEEIQATYRSDARLKPPRVVMSHSPAGWHEETLSIKLVTSSLT